MRAMPPNPVLHGRPGLTLRVLWAIPLVLAAGCARSPSADASGIGTRVTFKFKTEAVPNPSLVYVVAIQPSVDRNPSTTGPIPVVGPPWGNGFVAGNAKYFVRWDPAQRRPYVLYRFQNTILTSWVDDGEPLVTSDPRAGAQEFSFTLDLAQLADSEAEARLLQSLQVNFLTMDRVPQGTDPRTKVWDGLGDSRSAGEINSYVTVALDTSRTYDNRFFGNLEPTGDVSSPELDLRDFSIQVRLP